MKIRTYPDPVLRRKVRPIRIVTEEIREVIKEMSKLMYVAGGIGLAAPQVGISKQLIIMDVGGGLKCFINPKIIKRKGSSVLEEGCLSFPGITVRIKRAAEVCVEALDEDGKPVKITGEGLAAHVLQHEIDHLHAKLIIDYAGLRDRLRLRSKLKEFALKHKSEDIKCSVKSKCI